MKKLSKTKKQNLKNVERSLIQDLSEQQASALTGGQRLVQEFEAELATISGRNKHLAIAVIF